MHHRAFDQQQLELSTATLNIRNMKLAEKNSMNTTGKKSIMMMSMIVMVMMMGMIVMVMMVMMMVND